MQNSSGVEDKFINKTMFTMYHENRIQVSKPIDPNIQDCTSVFKLYKCLSKKKNMLTTHDLKQN